MFSFASSFPDEFPELGDDTEETNEDDKPGYNDNSEFDTQKNHPNLVKR
jgi:hypothetical protein